MINKTHAITIQLVETALENTKQLFQLLTKEAALLKTKTHTNRRAIPTS
jgi:hypothetical protein